VAWVEEGQISTPYDSTQGRAEKRFTVHQRLLYSTSSTTVLLTGWMGLTVHQAPSVQNNI
jgi:hypothetical protein